MSLRPARIAVLLPCLDEEVTIAQTVAGFRAALPEATIHVYDNGSADRTVERARAAGALVGHEPRRGKGHVVRRMFSEIDADVYLLADGDATYDPRAARALVDAVLDRQVEMVVGKRVHGEDAAYRPGHLVGNRLLSAFLARLFGSRLGDALSGYRAFSRRFVESFPARSAGFELETELTVHALTLHLPVEEIETAYVSRPPGSRSKLHTVRDGLRIVRVMLSLFRRERPLVFFGLAGALLVSVALLGRTVAIGALALACLAAGVVLQRRTRRRRAQARLAYGQARTRLP